MQTSHTTSWSPGSMHRFPCSLPDNHKSEPRRVPSGSTATIHHWAKILAFLIHRWPYRHHHFDSHGMQLIDHGFRVRPVFPVKFPVTLQRPVKEIDHDLINMNAFFLVSSGHFQHLFLGAVAKFTLPQPHAVLWKTRSRPVTSVYCSRIFLGVSATVSQ